MRKWLEFEIGEAEKFTDKLLNWGNQFDNFILLNSNIGRTDKHLYQKYEIIAACTPVYRLGAQESIGFESLKSFHKLYDDWIFGYFSYDLKNETEKLFSNNYDGIKFPEIYFFVPKYVFLLRDNILRIEFLQNFSAPDEIYSIFNEINKFKICQIGRNSDEWCIKQRISANQYIEKVDTIKTHIIKGDIYEMNFCHEFFIENIDIEAINLYIKLNQISPTPFSVFFKIEDKFLLSSSPERFLAKRGNKIISQPIKGTIKRGQNPAEDAQLKSDLYQNDKERAENVMIVDLVRNDLSKTAKQGSVKVEELCKIYTYEQVHQMISTICCEMDSESNDIIDVIKNAFPMGSMTGAPKIKAMELIEKYETTKRGLYSGSVGYISPEKDFDFNVVIRSILYNSTEKYLSFIVGSAITGQSIATKEYEECLLKAKAMQQVLEHNAHGNKN